MRGSHPLGPAIQVALMLSDPMLEMIATLLADAESVCGLPRIAQEAFQLGALRALAGDRGVAPEIGRFLRGPGGERLQLLPARGDPPRQRRAGFPEMRLEPGP